MKTKSILWILIVGLVGWIGCNDDGKELTPSGVEEYELVIPQGNHEYDARIMDWFDRTGVYVLYKFNPVDVYFNLSSWQGMYPDTVRTVNYYEMKEGDFVKDSVVHLAGVEYKLGATKNSSSSWQEVSLNEKTLLVVNYKTQYEGNFSVENADEAYVSKQLDLLEQIFLNFYSDTLLASVLPLKIILGRELKSVAGNQQTLLSKSYLLSFNNFIFSHGDETVETMTDASKKTIKNDLNKWFLQTYDKMKDRFSYDDFYDVSDYYWAGGSASSRPVDSMSYRLGFVKRPYASAQLSMIEDDDSKNYFNMIFDYSYTTLTATPPNGNYNANDLTGILHPLKDRNGLIRRKYNILIDAFKEQGIDIQTIGNYLGK